MRRSPSVSFSPPGPAAAGDLLTSVKAKGTLTVGTEARFPPFEFVEDGKIVGYSADIMTEVMKALPGVKLERARPALARHPAGSRGRAL